MLVFTKLFFNDSLNVSLKMKISKQIEELLKIENSDEIDLICDDYTINWKRVDGIFQNIRE